MVRFRRSGRGRDVERLRRAPVWSARVWWRVAALLIIPGLFAAGMLFPRFGLVTPLQLLGRMGVWLEYLTLFLVLVVVRSLWLEFIAFRANSPIEVRSLDNATKDRSIDIHQLDVAFGDYLALSRLYQVPTLPGDQEPDRLIEVLNASASRGWKGTLSVFLAYTFPRRAFIVTASLLERERDQKRCGVSVQVRKLPGLPVRLESQWSTTYERALLRAAYAVGAHITQQTRACRRVPWSEWENRRRQLPASLFRDYQRAKQMVRERRYDEALALYHSALRQDAGNIAIRYDIGQLYERLGLYPDALFTYLGLVDEIFPVKKRSRYSRVNISASSADGNTDSLPDRVSIPLWWPGEANRDPFIIRYRYVVALGQAALLAREFTAPQWQQLRRWINPNADQLTGPSRRDEQESYPWRATELADITRLVSHRLDTMYGPSCGTSLAALLVQKPPADSASYQHQIARYLLTCAAHEARLLVRDVERLGRRLRGLRSRRNSFLTPTAVRQVQLAIRYGLRRAGLLDHSDSHRPAPPGMGSIGQDLREAGYVAEHSVNWLEHYNAACLYASALLDDSDENPEHNQYAYAAVAALDQAARYGEQVEFVASKRYWLQAGDPDLAGLRYYRCFRAFEARVYGLPFPATADLSKYELYRFLRMMIRRAAGGLEDAWRSRARNLPDLTHTQFESWWRQEMRAWEMAIRIGRFYHQWQARHAALSDIRNWIESIGPEAQPIPYPNIAGESYRPHTSDYGLIHERQVETEALLAFLGYRCGQLMTAKADPAASIFDNTRHWTEYARACSRSVISIPSEAALTGCRARSGIWAALRQWAEFPGDERQQIFEEMMNNLPAPPTLPPAPGKSS